MKLYTWLSAPNPRRATMFVAEKGIDIEIVEASDPGNPAELSDAFCERHPHRRVPLLELDDGDWIGEAAICRYLETIYPDNLPWEECKGSRPRRNVGPTYRMGGPNGRFGGVSKHSQYVDRGLPGYDVEIPQTLSCRTGRTRLGRFFSKIDVQLGRNEFLAGDAFSFADITALCAIDFAISRRLFIPETCGNLRKWHTAVSGRPAASGLNR